MISLPCDFWSNSEQSSRIEAQAISRNLDKNRQILNFGQRVSRSKDVFQVSKWQRYLYLYTNSKYIERALKRTP